jgi:putative endonuclease
MKILARNYRCPSGEIDIIAFEPAAQANFNRDTVVFVEVKTRTSDRYTDPESAVNSDKRRRIRNAASCYISSHQHAELSWRYDIVSIVLAVGKKPVVNHIVQAFV